MDKLNKQKALDYLLTNASKLNISQYKLCEGVYDYSHFNRMCNGKEKIKIEVLLLCAQNVCLPIQDVWNHYCYENYEEYKNYLDEFMEDMEHFKIDKINTMSKLLEKKNLSENNDLKQLYHYLNAIICMTNQQYHQAKSEIILGIKCKHKDFNLNISKKRYFSNIEKLMLVDLMTLFRFFKEYDQALIVYEIAKFENQSRYYNAVLNSTISPVLRAKKQFKEDHELLEDTISKCIEHYDFRQIGICYIELAHCIASMNASKDCYIYLKKARDIYNLTNHASDFLNEKGLNYLCMKKSDALFCFEKDFQFDIIYNLL